MKRKLLFIFLFCIFSSQLIFTADLDLRKGYVLYLFDKSEMGAIQELNRQIRADSSLAIDPNTLKQLKGYKRVKETSLDDPILAYFDNNDIGVICFENNGKFVRFVDIGIDNNSLVKIFYENKSKEKEESVRWRDKDSRRGVCLILEFDKILKNNVNGDKLGLFVKINDSLNTNTEYVTCYKSLELYGLSGFWLPIGLNSLDINGLSSPDSLFSLTTAPVSLAWGFRINPNPHKSFYWGITAYINYSATSTDSKVIVGNVSVGSFIDFGDFIYFGWNVNFKRGDDDRLIQGPVIGFGPNLLKLIKGT